MQQPHLTPYLQSTPIINHTHPAIQSLAKELAQSSQSDVEIAKNCFIFVRDEIRHTGDYRDDITTCTASEVLEYRTGWCYAKSHLLAALLRANAIPAGLCYQRLSCSEYKEGIYCLHGLNAVYLKNYGWYRIDARGNKEGVNARFDPPHEYLAFIPQADEYDLPDIYEAPLDVVVTALQRYKTYREMVDNFPDIASC